MACLIRSISAVFLLALKAGRILAVQNDRGWDLPGGHVEPGESPLQALEREVLEEAGALFRNATPCVVLHEPPREDVMLMFATADYELVEWTPADDCLNRAEVPVPEFIARYHGDQAFMRALIDAGEQALGSGSIAARE